VERGHVRLQGELYAALMELKPALGGKRYPKALEAAFARMPATSIDYGVAERAQNIAVVPGSFGWSDVGSFNALSDVRAADSAGNVVEGHAIALDSSGCVLLGQPRRPLAVVGMKDTVVVDAGDAILVVPKGRSQDVRLAVEHFKKNKLSRYL
jgi:mannose-1-phosphate guanylyltransferase